MNFKKEFLKKTPEELQEYLKFKRRHSIKKSKKGKSSYSRKNKNNIEY